MLYFQYVFILCLFFSTGNGNGIINTQTVLSVEKQNAKKTLTNKKEDVLQSIKDYKTKLEEGNRELKKSIKLLKAIIEIKKDSLIQITGSAKNQTNARKL